jgi:hypothetical protein
MGKKELWFRWVSANAFGELFGLRLIFAVAVFVISGIGNQNSLWP